MKYVVGTDTYTMERIVASAFITEEGIDPRAILLRLRLRPLLGGRDALNVEVVADVDDVVNLTRNLVRASHTVWGTTAQDLGVREVES